MPDARPEALEFLLSRRSRPAKMLGLPVPDRTALETMLTAALRVPDHGKLEPWRLIVLEKPALERLAELMVVRSGELQMDAEKAEKTRQQMANADLVVAVIAAPVQSEKIPAVEQTMSAGAVCLSMLNAALASGWGANWLTGWMASDRGFLQSGLNLAAHETVAGFIHIGTERHTPPDRPRPDLANKVTWVDQ